MPQRPNLLVIMSDEHDPAVTGCYGDPLVRTPRLDRLAAEGITFDACYCNSPLCVPSRLSFTAGQYVSRCGGWNNSCWLPSDDYPSLPRALARAGYETVLCGKQHYDATRRYGFTTDLIPELNDAFKTGRGGRSDPDNVKIAHQSWTNRSAEFHPGYESEVLDHDRIVTEEACRFLDRRDPDAAPFMLFAGHLAPHFPLIAPEHLYNHYKGRVPMPDLPPGLIDNLPRNYKHQRYGFGTVDVPDELTQYGRDLYWALTDWYDVQVGRVLDALAASPFAENTVVVYTSDHGENKGDHGMWWKNCLYEHGARVPLIVRWPERWKGGQRRSGACSLVDVVQTLAALGGAEAHEQWDGDSMLAYLDDPRADWKDFALTEYYGHNICSGITMVRQGRHKYVYHSRANERHGPERELFDLSADPKEHRNLAHDPAHAPLVERLHAAMLKELGEDPEAIELRCRTDYAKGYGREKPK
ncbi:MAG: sulfatase-like hydrolase/transferase [Planctomycetes bacterium]|nr:sulfatase-like hydrolase/transferase [Planctomycetota bacterium]